MFSLKYVLIFILSFSLLSCSSVFDLYGGGTPKISLDKRLNVFRKTENEDYHWNLKKPVDIYWTKEAIPFISAQTDRDAFYASGVIQAHLRGTQLEMFRLLSQGRVSEAIGERSLALDIFLRTVNVGKVADEIINKWSQETKKAAQAFVEGINDYYENQLKLPLDMKVMGLKEIEPWTVKDLVYVHRLMGLDINWKIWKEFMEVHREKGSNKFKKFWNKWVADYFIASGGKTQQSDDQALDLNILNSITEAGSNAFVVSGKKTKSGKPVVAGDPHLGISMPSYWMFFGMESPSYKVFGVSIPSFPIPVMGRTKDIAWTGTNMWGVNSFLYDVSEMKDLKVKKREETFKVRFSEDVKVTVEDSNYGPLVSETDFFKSSKKLALKWAGHQTSLEFEALLEANKAKDVYEFRKALESFSIAAINYVAADKKGNITKVHATHLPVLKDHKKTMILKPENKIINYLDVMDLPAEVNPKRGYVVSANEFNKQATPSLCWFCSTPDRAERISELLETGKTDFPLTQKIHTDVYSKEADDLIRFFKSEYKDKKIETNEKFKTLSSWDRNYTVEAHGPYLYEEFVVDFARQVYEKEGLEELEIQALFQNLNWKRNVLDQYKLYKPDVQKGILKTAMNNLRSVRDYEWGEIHKITVVHPLAKVPVFGSSYRFYRGGYPGSSNTVFKAAHSYGTGDYRVNFGANLRVYFDLSKENENYAVLLGGQDGFLGSKNFFDQTPLWLEGKYIKIPFTSKAIQKNASYKVQLL